MRRRWRCFHCDEVFRSRVHAAAHFGSDETRTVACRLKAHDGHLVHYIRDLEQQLDRYRAEDSDVMRAIYTMEADHQQALLRAEEIGYGRGVEDLRVPLAEALQNLEYVQRAHPEATGIGRRVEAIEMIKKLGIEAPL